MKAEYPTLEFPHSAQWRKWLAEHHADTDGIWLRIYKKASGVLTVSYAEALDEALCFGWIDGQKKSYDEISFIQKFTPRRARSMWSKRNIEHVSRLTDAGLMMPQGLAEVERARADGRWQSAYDAQKDMAIPEDFLVAVRKDKKASAFFDTLKKSDHFAIGFRLQTAKKPETRASRMDVILELMKNGKKLH